MRFKMTTCPSDPIPSGLVKRHIDTSLYYLHLCIWLTCLFSQGYFHCCGRERMSLQESIP